MAAAFEASGVWTALVTPMRTDGAVDDAALKRLIEFQVAEGITGVLPCGTTGESPTLSWQEHDAVIDRTVEAVAGRVGVLAGTGSNNTREAIRGTKHAKEIGASAVLLVDCYYNGPSSLELRTHYYAKILEEVPEIPIVPYVIPGRTGCALGAADLAILHQEDPQRVPAVKQATGDLERMRQDRELAGETLAIMSGDDELTLPMMRDAKIVASGVISVMSNLVPGTLARMIQLEQQGQSADADQIAKDIAPLIELVGCALSATRSLPDGRSVEVQDKFRNPLPIKTMLAGLGVVEPGLRAPLAWMTQAGVHRCREALRAVHAQNAAVLEPLEAAFDVDVAARLADDEAWSRLVRA